MNFYQATNAVWDAEDDARIKGSEMILIWAYLQIWNHHRRPVGLDSGQWQEVVQYAQRRLSRASIYAALANLIEAGWLSCCRKGAKVEKVCFGAALLSKIQTGEGAPSPESGRVSPESGRVSPESGRVSPESGRVSPESGLPYYVQGTEEEVQDSQDARRRAQEEEGGGELGEQAPSYARIIPMFEAVFDRTLSRDAVAQLARHSREFLEPIAAYYSAPPGEDERRYRRRSFESLMANIEQEHDRAVCWLRSEAAKPYRPRRDLAEWKEAVRAIPESLLPADWLEQWEIHMREDSRPWAEVGPRSRQVFLACLFSDGMVNRALGEQNPTVARYYARRWLRKVGHCA